MLLKDFKNDDGLEIIYVIISFNSFLCACENICTETKTFYVLASTFYYPDNHT